MAAPVAISLVLNGTTYTIYVKTDWTANDVINFGDFNRLETNTVTVRAYLTAIQYAIPALTTKADRDNQWIDMLSSMNRIESNIDTIRTNFSTPLGYPGSRTWSAGDGFDWRDAIRLERDLELLFVDAGRVYEGFMYCGEFFCGEGGDL